VVVAGCNNNVQPAQLAALLADLSQQLNEDGIEKRARMVARSITRKDHQVEVLRIAALMAHISGGVSEEERKVIDVLAKDFSLDSDEVEQALTQAEAALKHEA
jgi:tellurite resistance protein